MDYEKAYKQALERARKLYNEAMANDYVSDMEDYEQIFPELKESEDERIRKDIIRVFKGEISFTTEEDNKKYITWLEKQCEPQDKGEISDGYHTFNELYYYRMLYNAAFFNMLPKEWVHKSKRHNDGEECFGGGWFIVMANLPTGQISNHYELKDWDLFQIPEKEVADKWDGHTPQEAADRLHKYILEKQGEQKSVDKIEPNFNVGDWVITKNGNIAQILDKQQHAFVGLDINGNDFVCNYRHTSSMKHWTIQDAKDGDVLATKNGNPFIYDKNRYNNGLTYYYAGLGANKELTLKNPHNMLAHFGELRSVFPATEEQRDLLFKKIHKAGYEWDAENKELKKIEQKPADKLEPKFHEGDWIISDTVNKDYHICKIIGIKDGNYTIESIYGYKGHNQFDEFDNVYRLWTIQDAKDGNVLVNGSNIFIFSNLSSTRVMGYCHINLDDGRFYDDKGKNECFGLIDAVFTPTTKEQYFLLFQKMKEAGYEWDAEKKELKKIEANSIWSEDDEAFLYEAIYAVKNFFKGCAQDELVHWLKSLYESKGKNNRSLYESKGKNNGTDYRC